MSMSSVIRYVQALDTSATDGSGKTGLAHSDITAKYLTAGGTLTSLTTETISTLGTYAAPTSAAHIRIKEVSNTDPSKGIYEVHFHNTQMAASGKRLWLFLSASGARFQPIEVDLIPFMDADSQSAADLKDLADSGYDPSNHEIYSLSAFGEDSLITNIDATSTQLAAILTAIGNLNNLSALANVFGPNVLEIPDSSSVAYPFTMTVKDNEGKLVDLDSTPSVSAVNAGGTDRSANLSSPTHDSTGVYTFTYTVASNHAAEGIRIIGTGTVSAEARRVDIGCLVSDLDSSTAIAAIKAKVDTLHDIRIPGVIQPQTGDSYGRLGAPAGASVSADIAAVKSDTGTLTTRITNTLFSGITYLSRWLGALAGKTADSSTLTEIQATTAGATYNNVTDSLENIKDNLSGGGGGGGAAGSGGIECILTIKDTDSIVIGGARVWVSTDSAGTNVVAGTLTTDDFGQVTFMLDAGTYYRWANDSEHNFTNPQSFTVT